MKANNMSMMKLVAIMALASILLLATRHVSLNNNNQQMQQKIRRTLVGSSSDLDPRTVEEKEVAPMSSSSSSNNDNNDFDFRVMAGLAAIITGLEHAGTTMFANMLYNVPCIMGAYETGYLLAESPAEIDSLHPTYEWNRNEVSNSSRNGFHPQLNYHLSDDDCQAMKEAKNFANMYQILRHKSRLFSSEYIPTTNIIMADNDSHSHSSASACETPYQIIDKSPSYIQPEYFEDILEKTPMVPVFVLDRRDDDKEAEEKASAAHRRHKTAIIHDNIRAMQTKYPGRIHIITFGDLMSRPETVMRQVFSILELKDEWKTEYLEMKGLLSKLQNFPDSVRAEIAPWLFQEEDADTTTTTAAVTTTTTTTTTSDNAQQDAA